MAFLFLTGLGASATDWPQYRGPFTDGTSPDTIRTNWSAAPPVVVWTNRSLTNGFSSFAVSQGRAFTLISKDDGTGTLLEYCVGVDATTGTNIWAVPIGDAPWDPSSLGNGGDGLAPYNTGDGPRTTPSVQDGRVYALSARLSLVCMSATNGSVVWSNNLKTIYGATEVGSGWNNSASPVMASNLIFINLNTTTNKNLCAFSITNGSRVWGTSNEKLTHTTPVTATILGTQQVLFATTTGIVGLDRSTGSNLWKYTYAWGSIDTSMGAAPVAYSNAVFCTAGYNKGAAAFWITFTNNTWYATNQLWKQTYPNTKYQSTWMTPVAYQGFLYGQFSHEGYVTGPLNCLNLTTSNVMWSAPNFGMGGTILVNNYVVSLTEDGQLVLIKPDPAAYTELGRIRIFQFSANNPGKCWNSPAYSNGRVYARSTAGAICLDASPTAPPMQLPALVAAAATNVTASTASLRAVVNPNGTPTAAWFQWGFPGNCTNATSATVDSVGVSLLALTNVITGLTPGTAYAFRVVATNSAGATNGPTLAFSTLAPPTLSIGLTSNRVTLCWPSYATGYGLQASDTVAPATWQTMPQTPETGGGLTCVSIPASEAKAFYRLYPALSITRLGSSNLVSWSALAAEYALQRSTSLVSPVWTGVLEPVQDDGATRWVVTGTLEQQEFYRLSNQ